MGSFPTLTKPSKIQITEPQYRIDLSYIVSFPSLMSIWEHKVNRNWKTKGRIRGNYAKKTAKWRFWFVTFFKSEKARLDIYLCDKFGKSPNHRAFHSDHYLSLTLLVADPGFSRDVPTHKGEVSINYLTTILLKTAWNCNKLNHKRNSSWRPAWIRNAYT